MTMNRAQRAVKEYLIEKGSYKARSRNQRILEEICITPEIAKQMLKCQPSKKRRLNRILLLTMKEVITKRDNVSFIQPIIFDNWKLMDGIHRLQACVDTNTDFVSDVKFLYTQKSKRLPDYVRERYIDELFEHMLPANLMLKLMLNNMKKQMRKLEKAMKEFLNRLPDDPLMDLWKTRKWYRFDVIIGIGGMCEHVADLRSVNIYLLPIAFDQKVSKLIGIIAHEFAHSFIGPLPTFCEDDDDLIETHEENEELTDELVREWGFAKEMDEARNIKKP